MLGQNESLKALKNGHLSTRHKKCTKHQALDIGIMIVAKKGFCTTKKQCKEDDIESDKVRVEITM